MAEQENNEVLFLIGEPRPLSDLEEQEDVTFASPKRPTTRPSSPSSSATPEPGTSPATP
jgi:hypothetical protein